MFENSREFGKWRQLGSSDGDSIMFNSSHTYPISVEDYIESIKNIMANRYNPPVYIELRPTNECNHNCGICYSHDFRLKNRTALDQTRSIRLLDEAKELGVKAIRFCGGGEPLLWEGIEKAIEKAFNMKFGVELISNGSRFNEENISNITENSHYLRISLNGGANSHQIFHNCSGYEYPRIIKNLSRIASIRSQKNLENQLYLAVTYILSSANIPDIYETAKTIMDSGFDAVFFRVPATHLGFTISDQIALRNEYNQCLQLDTSRFLIHFAQRAFDPSANPSVNHHYCYQSQMRLYIEATGNIAFCSKYSQTKEKSLGNIYDAGLIDIWKNYKARMEFSQDTSVNCTECDSVYFNSAMSFVQCKLKKDPQIGFNRVFNNS